MNFLILSLVDNSFLPSDLTKEPNELFFAANKKSKLSSLLLF